MKLLVLAALLLAGCSAGPTLAQYQADCQKQYPSFVNMVPCLRGAVDSDSREKWKNNERVQLYLSVAEMLRTDVESGERSAAAAEVDLKLLLLKIRQIELQEAMARGQAMQTMGAGIQQMGQGLQQMQPQQRPSTGLNCNTTYMGNRAFTSCY